MLTREMEWERQPGRGMGLIPEKDERNSLFGAAPVIAAAAPVKIVDTNYAMFYKPLNQGSEGTCVGHGFKHSLMAGPIIQTTPLSDPVAVKLYDGGAARDPWPENDPGKPNWRSHGTSLEAVAGYMVDLELMREYRWAQTVDEVAAYIGGLDAAGKHIGGPVVFGFPWYDCWYDTDDEGFLVDPRKLANARVVGGHCVAGFRWEQNSPAPFVGGPNSWGTGFGAVNPKTGMRDGRWKMDADVLHWLLTVQGADCCLPVEIRRKPAPAGILGDHEAEPS